MTCPNCATTLEEGARFCGVCGHRLDAPDERRADTVRATPRAGVGKKVSAADLPAAKKGDAAKKADAPAAKKPVAVPPPAADPYVGTTLNGRFTVEKKLGEGGFGAVYNGVQLLTARRVAIKLLHPEMTRDQNVVARFRREGQVLCSLRDAHTITTYDFDQTADGTLFIAMELLEGRSLHDIFHDEAPIAWQRMLKIIGEMCSSLEEAHSLGIVHRDLKPENIYLEARPGNPEFVKVLDFGIAKVMRGDGSSGIAGDMSPQLTATGQTLGTLEYMSPEQLMGKPLDGRSDIYAVGVVAFEMLTGRLPFPDAVGPAALISAQLKKTPPNASEAYAKGNIPPVVDQLLLKMLAKDKSQRFRDMSDLRREIDGILASGGTSALRPAVPSDADLGLTTIDQRPKRSQPAVAARQAAAPAVGSPAAAVGGHAAPRAAPSVPMSAPWAAEGPRVEAGADLADPPWAGSGRVFGTSVEESPLRSPRATANPAGAAEIVAAARPLTRSSSPPWMWITVGAILVLAIAIGTVLAMR